MTKVLLMSRTSVLYYLKVLNKELILYFTSVLCMNLPDTCDSTEIYTRIKKDFYCRSIVLFNDMLSSYEFVCECMCAHV